MFRFFFRFYIRAKAGDNTFNTGNFVNVYRKRSSHTSLIQMVMVSSSAPSRKPSTPPPPPRQAPPPPPPPSARRPGRAWVLAGGAVLTAGAVYLYRRARDVPPPAAPVSSRAVSDPALASALPARTQYLLVGGGTAAFSAFRAIRTRHPGAQVVMVCAEDEVPYMRPPLSKQVWSDPSPAVVLQARAYPRPPGRRSLLYEPDEYFSGAGVLAARGWRLLRLHPADRRALLQSVHDPAQQAEVRYEECLLATGARGVPVPALEAVRARVLSVRTATDAQRLAARLETGASAVVVGTSLRAAELAAHLPPGTTWCGAEGVPGDAPLPHYLRGELQPDAHVVSSEMVEGRAVLTLSDGRRLTADVVVEAAREEPAVGADWGVELDAERGGVLVGPELQARAHLYAAGDLASYYCEERGERVRAEGHDHAVVSGRLAGDNMAAALLARLRHAEGDEDDVRPYRHTPLVWAELGDNFLETVGSVEAGLRREGVWATPGPPSGKGVVFYRDAAGRVKGVLLWNLVGAAHAARAVLALSLEEQADAAELAKLFPLYDREENEGQLHDDN